MDHDKDRMGEMINTFWNEFEYFQSHTGPYSEREYIYKNHADLDKRAYLWHKKESLRYTTYFGEFACRVCSKILGIGSAERSWGDVKTLKTNKRSHLSGERVKKQATIFGASCIEQARFQRLEMTSSGDVSTSPLKFWRDDDFNDDDSDDGGGQKKITKRLFKAYLEDWEIKAVQKKDVVNEVKLLKKYGGLSWQDPDNNNKLLYADNEKLHWQKQTKKSEGGYCVYARGENYKKCMNEDDETDTEPWFINEDLIWSIEEYYKANKHFGVVVEPQHKENNNDEMSEDSSMTEEPNKEATFH